MDPDTLEPVVESLLAEHPEGLEEQGLLRRLRERRDTDMPAERPVTPLALFRAHFVLFHVLYRLRDRLRSERRGDVRIDPACIRLLAYDPGEAALDAPDRLRAYYLDLANLERTGAADVARLLRGFERDRRRHAARAEALATLGLGEAADRAAIRHQYRRLAMRHHPDRGGDPERFATIRAAAEILLAGPSPAA